MTAFFTLNSSEFSFELSLNVGHEVKRNEFELTNANLATIHVEVLEVTEDQGARRAASHSGLGREEFHTEGIDVFNTSDLGEFFGHTTVRIGRRRGLEDHRVREDGTEHGASDIGRDLETHVVVHQLEDGVRATHRPDDAFKRRRRGDVAQLVVVNNTLQIALIDISRSLTLVGVVNEVNITTSHARHNFRGFETEAFKNESRFRSGRTLSSRHHIETAKRVEMCASNGGNDAVGVGVLMTKNECGHLLAL